MKAANYESSLPIHFRKEHGIFYSANFITHYIVSQTIGQWLAALKETLLKSYLAENQDFWFAYLTNLKSITVLDNACGAGAFLVEAFHYLQTVYQEIPIKIDFDTGKYIVENCLFGVDIDANAVQLTQNQIFECSNFLCPNIKQGNSLITDKEVTALAFDWEKEFPTVFSGGGFDIVVGNPPYGAGLTKEMVAHFEKIYQTFEYQVNSYVIFYEKGLNLLKMNGLLGYITPATFIHQHYFKKIRSLFNKYQIISICKYEYEVFDEATTGDTVSWVIQKKENEFLPIACKAGKSKQEVIDAKLQLFSYQEVVNTDGTYALNGNSLNMIKIRAMSVDLGKIANIIVGIKPYQVGKGNPKQTEQTVKNKPFTATYKIDKSYYLCAVGGDFHRYQWLNSPNMYLSYGKWLAEPRESAPFFEEEKIILRQTSDSLIAHLDTSKLLNLNNVYNIGNVSTDFSIKYILAILNSKLMNYIYQKISQERGKTFAEVKKVYLVNLPIADLSLEHQQPLISLVNQVLMLKSQNQDTSLLEKEIDEAVYQIYGITGEEIKVIENQ